MSAVHASQGAAGEAWLAGRVVAGCWRFPTAAWLLAAPLVPCHPACACFPHPQRVETYCPAGLVGILLSLAGAEVTLTDQPHIVPLADANAQARAGSGGGPQAEQRRRRPGQPLWHLCLQQQGPWADDAVRCCRPAAAGELHCCVGQAPHASLTPILVQANLTPGLHRWRVVTYTWGQGNPAAALLQPPDGQQGSAAPAAAAAAAAAAATAAAAGQGVPGAPPPLQQPPPGALPLTAGSLPSRSYDVVTAADVVYQPEVYAELAATLAALAAPHTLVLLSYKQRGAWWREVHGRARLLGVSWLLRAVHARRMQ